MFIESQQAEPTTRKQFMRGFQAMIPLWLGAIPFGLAYAVTARAAGLNLFETQLMSVAVFAGGAQFSAVGLFGVGAASITIIITTLLLNIRHVLYGLSLGRTIRLSWPQRLLSAHFLTDEAYGVTVAAGETSFSYLFGAELGMFVAWNAATFVGAQLGAGIPDPAQYGIDFVFPLAFLALLIPLIRKRTDLAVAVCAGLTALAVSRVATSGLAILTAGIAGSLFGAWLTRDEPTGSEEQI